MNCATMSRKVSRSMPNLVLQTLTIDTTAGSEEVRMLKSDVTTLVASTINASSLTALMVVWRWTWINLP